MDPFRFRLSTSVSFKDRDVALVFFVSHRGRLSLDSIQSFGTSRVFRTWTPQAMAQVVSLPP